MERFPRSLALIMSLLCFAYAFPATAQTPLLEIDYNGATVFHVLDDGRLLLPSGATDGYVLTADASGFATWQAVSGGGGAITSDATLTGDGTPGNPLGVAVPLVLTGGTGSGGTVYGEHSQGHRGLLGSNLFGVLGLHSGGNIGTLGSSDYGVYGFSNTMAGVYGGHGNGHWGLLGSSSVAVVGANANGNNGHLGGDNYGVRGWNDNDNRAYLGHDNSGIWATGSPRAGYFEGNVQVTGGLSKAGGSFKIDHPLDPANKYLSHSFVESPDMMNVYNGNAVLNAEGEAVVELPAYFEALNRDFRYQLTCLGGFAPVYVAEEIQDNRFTIAGGTPGMKVSWQVTGIRQDAWADENRIIVEADKLADERGRYLHPALYGQPETQGIGWIEEDEASMDQEAMRQQVDQEHRRMQAERERLRDEQERR